MSGTHAISTTSRRELSSSFFFLQGKAPKEIHAILTETLACFLPGRAKDLSAPLYNYGCTNAPHKYIIITLSVFSYLYRHNFSLYLLSNPNYSLLRPNHTLFLNYKNYNLFVAIDIYTGCGRKNSPIWEANKFETKEDTANVFFISG